MGDLWQAIGQIPKLFAPNQQDFPTEHWDGFELRYGRLTFRPANFKIEGAIFAVALVYFLVALLGQSLNSKRANAWLSAHQTLYEAQFAKPGGSDSVIADGPTDYLVFSTGRRAVAYLQTIITLFPRHDIVQWIYEIGYSMYDLTYTPQDVLHLDFKLAIPYDALPGFVLAIISKHHLPQTREERFDLAFTKLSENTLLPPSASLMSEAFDVTELVLKSKAGTQLLAILKQPEIAAAFISLIISDQPETRPKGAIPADKKERHVELKMVLPPPSKSGLTEPLIKAVFDLIDFLDSKPPIRDDVARKLMKVRAELDAELNKEALEPTPEEKEEIEHQKALAKRKAEEEKFALMTPDQQRKYEEKERKKAQRKAQGKMVYK